MAGFKVTDFARMKAAGEPIAMLTCYDYSTAKLMNTTAVDSLLVGDSLGTVMLGYPDTLSVTMEDMIRHTQAVVRGAPDKFVVADMPFMSYQTGVRDAVINAGRLVKDGHAQAVKLEGGSDF
ncbi:3-methyl-2-oxobutanoate hydroxymethyltransferase, partial [Duodenibacillus massiliensis]